MGEAAEARALKKQLKQPLEVEIIGGELRISIGLDILAFALQSIERWPEDYVIVDVEEFGKDVLRELKREEEDGTTPVHRLLDRVGLEALEQGSLGCAERCDGDKGE